MSVAGHQRAPNQRAPDQRAGTLWVLKLSLREWRGWTLIATITVLTSLAALLNPWPLKLLIDYALAGVSLPHWAARVPR